MKKITFAALLFSSLLPPSRSSAQWSAVCSTGNGFVTNFETHNGSLLATGFFTSLCGSPSNYVSQWGLTGWSTFGNGLPRAGHALKSINNELYAAVYQTANDSNWLYKYNSSTFEKLGAGVYLTTYAPNTSRTPSLYNAILYNGSLIACGEFDRVGTKSISGIMRWTGTQWDSLGAGLSGSVLTTSPVMYPHDMCLFNSDLVVGGAFKNAGGQIVNGIARWNGTQWSALGAGFNGVVYSVCVYNGVLYAGGDFTASGTTQLRGLAKWDGTAWVSPGFSFFYQNAAMYSYVHTLKEVNGQLAIAGGFDRAMMGSVTMRASGIALYNGSQIDTLGGGLPGKEVEAVAWHGGKLIAGGGLFGSSYIASYTVPTSIHQTAASSVPDIAVYPNPSSGRVVVSSELPISEVCVYDMTGILVYREHLNSRRGVVELKASGEYAFVVKSERGSVVRLVSIR